jgi:hypothetical protein
MNEEPQKIEQQEQTDVPQQFEEPLITTDEPGEPEQVIEMTTITTEDGNIQVVHQITLGDLLTSSLLFCMLLFLVISRVIRGR